MARQSEKVSIDNPRIKFESMRFSLMQITMGFALGIDMTGLLVEYPNAEGSEGGIAVVTILNCITTIGLLYTAMRRVFNPSTIARDNAADPEFSNVRHSRGCENLFVVDVVITILFIVRIVETAKFVSLYDMVHLDFTAPIPALTFSFATFLISVFARWYTPVLISSKN